MYESLFALRSMSQRRFVSEVERVRAQDVPNFILHLLLNFDARVKISSHFFNAERYTNVDEVFLTAIPKGVCTNS